MHQALAVAAVTLLLTAGAPARAQPSSAEQHFRELYRELGGAMTTLARTMLRDADEAADVVEDALLKVRDAATGFRGTRGLRTWVLRIVANRCRDLLRRRRFTAGRPEDFDPIAEAGLRSEPLASETSTE